MECARDIPRLREPFARAESLDGKTDIGQSSFRIGDDPRAWRRVLRNSALQVGEMSQLSDEMGDWKCQKSRKLLKGGYLDSCCDLRHLVMVVQSQFMRHSKLEFTEVEEKQDQAR